MESLRVIQSIQNRIYEVRGQRVMLDKDLAELYDVEVKALNQAVKRKLNRFPEYFMFRWPQMNPHLFYRRQEPPRMEAILQGHNL